MQVLVPGAASEFRAFPTVEMIFCSLRNADACSKSHQVKHVLILYDEDSAETTPWQAFLTFVSQECRDFSLTVNNIKVQCSSKLCKHLEMWTEKKATKMAVVRLTLGSELTCSFL